MNKDLISRSALERELLDKGFYPAIVRAAIEKAPTVDAEPVKHGHWIPDPQCSGFPVLDDDEHLKHYKCSACGRRIGCLAHLSLQKEKPYCHCGAKMDEEVENA